MNWKQKLITIIAKLIGIKIFFAKQDYFLPYYPLLHQLDNNLKREDYKLLQHKIQIAINVDEHSTFNKFSEEDKVRIILQKISKEFYKLLEQQINPKNIHYLLKNKSHYLRENAYNKSELYELEFYTKNRIE